MYMQVWVFSWINIDRPLTVQYVPVPSSEMYPQHIQIKSIKHSHMKKVIC